VGKRKGVRGFEKVRVSKRIRRKRGRGQWGGREEGGGGRGVGNHFISVLSNALAATFSYKLIASAYLCV
jgi:hypothetical protein